MDKTILNFIKKPFVRNVFILASGTAMAQIINMLFSPLLTRLYGPEAYGLMGTFSAIVQIVSPLAALSYPIAIVLPKEDGEAKEIVKLSFIITIINTIFSLLILFFMSDVIVRIFNLHTISRFIYFLPIVILSAGALQIVHQWLVRKNQFQVSAKANLIETTLVNTGKLFIGLPYPSASILIIFTAFRQGIRALLMYFLMGKLNLKYFYSFSKNNVQSIFSVAKKHKDFPLYRTSESTISGISNNAPILMLTSFFGPAAAGFYTIAVTVLGIPAALIAKSVGDVFYPKVAKAAQNKKKVTPLLIKTTLYLSVIGLVPYGLIILFGPWLFGIVFGQDWVIAGEYARWVSVWSFFNFINRPSVQSLPVISAQKFQLAFTVFKLIVTSFGLFVGFYIFNSDIISITLFSIIGAISYIFLIIATILKSKKFDELNAFTKQ